MDHADVREIMEIAAAEPGGFERLEAGDTPDSVAVASHLVECSACRAEWERLAALGSMLRTALAEPIKEPEPVGLAADLGDSSGYGYSAPPELRERTLRFVRELGKPAGAQRDAAVAVDASGRRTAVVSEPVDISEPSTAPEPIAIQPGAASRAVPGSPSTAGGRRTGSIIRLADRRPLMRLAAIAAAVVLIAGFGAFAYVRDQDAHNAVAQQASLQAANAALLELANEQAVLAAAPDAETVQLTSADGTARGWVLYSAQRDEMVMVATGLPRPGAGEALRCWVETGQGRRVLGDVAFEGGMGYWSGWPEGGLADVAPGTTFGVSVAQVGQAPGTGRVLMTGAVK